MTLTLTYLFPAAAQTSYTYAEATGVPIPIVGDSIGGDPDGYAYPVVARTFVYSGAQNLTIYFACGTEATRPDGTKV
jgi:hypothetical protein